MRPIIFPTSSGDQMGLVRGHSAQPQPQENISLLLTGKEREEWSMRPVDQLCQGLPRSPPPGSPEGTAVQVPLGRPSVGSAAGRNGAMAHLRGCSLRKDGEGCSMLPTLQLLKGSPWDCCVSPVARADPHSHSLNAWGRREPGGLLL